MSYKKGLLIAALLTSLNALALEGKVATNGELGFNFTPLVEDQESGVSFKPIHLKNGNYNLTLLDLELNFKEEGLKIGTKIKSSREDLRLNDFDLKYKPGITKTSKMVSHDIMPKLYIEYTSPKFKGLQSTSKLEYYVDNFWDQTRQYDSSTNTVVDLGRNYEYLDGSDKQKLGNTVLHSDLKGKIEGTETELDFSLDYKANQFYRFDKDEAYLKINGEVSSQVSEEVKLGAKYSFDTDLNFASKPFDQFDHSVDYGYPDFVAGNFVQNIDQVIETTVNFKPSQVKNMEVDLKLGTDIKNWLVGYEHYSNPTEVIWSVYKPKLEVVASKEVHEGLKVKPRINTAFEISKTDYLTNKKETLTPDVLATFNPEVAFGLEYEKELKEKGSVSNFFEFGYLPNITIAPTVTGSHYIKNNFVFKDNLEAEYSILKDLKFTGSLETEFKIPYRRGIVEKIESKLNVVSKLDYKINEKMKLNVKLKNEFSSNSVRKALDPSDLKNRVEFSTEYKYDIMENLGYSSKLVVSNNTLFDYYIENEKSYPDNNPKTDEDQGSKFSYFHKGYAKPTQSTNQFKLNNHVDYSKSLSDKLTLEVEGDLNTDLHMLAVTSSKVHDMSKKLDSDKMNPEISDYRKTRWNIGGKVELQTGVGFKYVPQKDLNVTFGVDTALTFERKVFNIIDEGKEKGLFGEIDKEFGFKKFEPKFNLGVEYKW